MTRILILFAAVLLTGCVGTVGMLTNHVTLTLDDQRCMTASRWGPVAITGDVADSECQAIVEGRRAREVLRMLRVAPAASSPSKGSST